MYCYPVNKLTSLTITNKNLKSKVAKPQAIETKGVQDWVMLASLLQLGPS